MNIIKSLLTGVLAAAAATSFADDSVDSYLYWMPSTAIEDVYDRPNTIDYDYAMVSADGGSTYLTFYNDTGSLNSQKIAPGMKGYSGFQSESVSSFLFELYKTGEDERVGWTTLNYGSAASYIFSDAMQREKTSVYTITSAIPEPTSGLLVLLGAAALALRRRDAKFARN